MGEGGDTQPALMPPSVRQEPSPALQQCELYTLLYCTLLYSTELYWATLAIRTLSRPQYCALYTVV